MIPPFAGHARKHTGSSTPPVSGTVTLLNSFAMLSGGTANPVVNYDTTGLAAAAAAGTLWAVMHITALGAPSSVPVASSSGNFLSMCTPANDGAGGYFDALFAKKITTADLTAHTIATFNESGGNYINVAFYDISAGLNTLAGHDDWIRHDYGPTTGSVTFPLHAPIAGSIGYIYMGLMYLPAGTAHTVNTGAIRNDIAGECAHGTDDADHGVFVGFISPSAGVDHTLGGYGAGSGAWQGGFIEVGS